MAHDEIMKLEAGRELDALVAEHVMGQTDFNHPCFYHDDGSIFGGFYCTVCNQPKEMADAKCVKYYSTYIADAWQVVEKMWTVEPGVDIMKWYKNGAGDIEWHVSFGNGTHGVVTAQAETAPLAICKAALLAVMDIRPR